MELEKKPLIRSGFSHDVRAEVHHVRVHPDSARMRRIPSTKQEKNHSAADLLFYNIINKAKKEREGLNEFLQCD